MALKRSIRVLVVDDSAVVRRVLRERLEAEPGIDMVETATHGRIALHKLERVNPDIITLDVEMPTLDGLSTLKQIMHRAPRPVIMLSAHTFDGAQKTLRALELGAVDFIQKPGGWSSKGVTEILDELVAKIKVLAPAKRPIPSPRAKIYSGFPLVAERKHPDAAGEPQSDRVVVVGASTGGTEAIRYLLGTLWADFPAGIVVTQHMPAGFTKAFALRLNEQLPLEVREAEHHDLIRPGRVLIAPGHRHVTVHRDGQVGFVKLSNGPRVCGHRPSVDVLFESAAESFGSRALGVILTGMGRDGANGLRVLRDAGGATVAQDEATCVVFGMPKAAIEIGGAERVIPLPNIPAAIARFAHND